MVVDIELRGSFAKRVDMRFANLKRVTRHIHLLVRKPRSRAGWIRLGAIRQNLGSLAELVARPVVIGDAGVLTAPVAGVKRTAGGRAGDKSPGASVSNDHRLS